LHRRKGRDAEGCFLVEGERAVAEVAGDPGVRFLFGSEERSTLWRQLSPEVEFYVTDDASLFATEHPQGIGAVVGRPATMTLDELLERRPVLVLDAIADPGNVGTIVRAVEWFGLGGIVLLPGTADPYSPKSVRSSMGAIVRCRLASSSVQEIVDCGEELIALDAGGAFRLGAAELPQRALYIVGSEAHGISDTIVAHARLVAIPGRGHVESLNASVAAGILCYELSRLDERA
jgi:TrmH family RNA methyltransferase